MIDRIVTWFVHGFSKSDHGLVRSREHDPPWWAALIRIFLVFFGLLGLFLIITIVGDTTVPATKEVITEAERLWYDVRDNVVSLAWISIGICGFIWSVMIFGAVIGFFRITVSELFIMAIIVALICGTIVSAPWLWLFFENMNEGAEKTAEFLGQSIVLFVFLIVGYYFLRIFGFMSNDKRIYEKTPTTSLDIQYALSWGVFAAVVFFIVAVVYDLDKQKVKKPIIVASTITASSPAEFETTLIMQCVFDADYALRARRGEYEYPPDSVINRISSDDRLQSLSDGGKQYLAFAKNYLLTIRYDVHCRGSTTEARRREGEVMYNELDKIDHYVLVNLKNKLDLITFCKTKK